MLTGRVIGVKYKPDATISDIKLYVQLKEDIPVAHQRYIYKDNELRNNESRVSAYIQDDEAKVTLVLRLRGYPAPGGGAVVAVAPAPAAQAK